MGERSRWGGRGVEGGGGEGEGDEGGFEVRGVGLQGVDELPDLLVAVAVQAGDGLVLFEQGAAAVAQGEGEGEVWGGAVVGEGVVEGFFGLADGLDEAVGFFGEGLFFLRDEVELVVQGLGQRGEELGVVSVGDVGFGAGRVTSVSRDSRSWRGTPISSNSACSRSTIVVTCCDR